jgi:hypothetical protein
LSHLAQDSGCLLTWITTIVFHIVAIRSFVIIFPLEFSLQLKKKRTTAILLVVHKLGIALPIGRYKYLGTYEGSEGYVKFRTCFFRG